MKLEDVERSWRMLDEVVGCWLKLKDVERSWRMLDEVGGCWMRKCKGDYNKFDNAMNDNSIMQITMSWVSIS